MQKSHIWLATALMTSSLGLGLALNAQPTTVQAKAHKARAAKVLKTSALKKRAYHINAGYLYKNAKLTKKVKSSRHLLKTTLYTYKSAHVKKANGKKAVYYYVKNKSGSVKGWAWRGNLQKTRSYAQQKKDIKASLSIVRTMSQGMQNSLLDDFDDVTPKDAYYGLGSVLNSVFLDYYDSDKADRQAAGKFYRLFQGRFSSTTNAKLAALYASYNDAENGVESSDDTYDAAYAAGNLFDALADAVSSLS